MSLKMGLRFQKPPLFCDLLVDQEREYSAVPTAVSLLISEIRNPMKCFLNSLHHAVRLVQQQNN